MKKYFNWLLALSLVVMCSCSEDKYDMEQNEGMVDFTVTTSIPSTIQTYSSHNGGATNVNAANYDLRYILEVWTKESPRRLAYRGYKIVDNNFTTTDVTFAARLLALDYDFVFWADFVNHGTTEATAHGADLFYTTNNSSTDAQIKANPAIDPGLQAISLNVLPAYNISQDARDAYYKVVPVDLRTQSVLGSVKLNRPFGKYRLISTDDVDGYLAGTSILKAQTEYKGSATLPTQFNALTGAVGTGTIDLSGLVFTCDVVQENAFVAGTTYTGAYVLSFDYIFAGVAQTVAFDVSVFSDAAANTKIGSRSISNIPIQKNKLTTIIGNFFTNTFDYTIIVDDEFDGGIAYTPGSVYIGTTKYANIDAALAAAAADDIIMLGEGVHTVSTANSVISKNLTIKGIVNSAIIEAINPAVQAAVPAPQGQNPIFLITTGDVTFDNVVFRTDKTPAPAAVDGLTIIGGSLTLNNVMFNGIVNKEGITGSQYGRCVTVYGASTTLTVTNSTFTNFNKNGIHMMAGDATVTNSNFVGSNLMTNGVTIAQNGIVFMSGTSGTVANCSFKNLNYDTDSACGVYVVTPGGATDAGGNTYSNNDYNWYEGTTEMVEVSEFVAASPLWAVNRYDVASWTEVTMAGKAAIKSTVNSTTDMLTRGVSYDGNFYNTQGRGIAAKNTGASEDWDIEAEIYISADMLSVTYKPFYIGVWGDAAAYPIIAASNAIPGTVDNRNYTAGAMTPLWKLYHSDGTWTNGPALTAGWHKIRMTNNLGIIEYYIDGVKVGAFNATSGSYPVQSVIIQNYNFGQIVASGTQVASTWPSYDFDAYFTNVKVTVRH